MTFTKELLSGSTNGKPILITVTTNGTAQTIHTATSSTSGFDEIWIYAYNNDTASHLLSILWGGTTEPGQVIKITIPGQSGRVLVCDGVLLNNSLIVKAYADTASEITLDGYVNNMV